MTNLLVVEDQTIRAMMQDPRIMQLLPCLAGAAQQIANVGPDGKDCAICKRKRDRITNDAMKTARNCVANTRGERLKSLLQILDARQIRITIKNAQGRSQVLTLS